MEKELATHSSVLAWRIPGTGEPGGLPSLGSHRVGQDGSDLAAALASSKGLDHINPIRMITVISNLCKAQATSALSLLLAYRPPGVSNKNLGYYMEISDQCKLNA